MLGRILWQTIVKKTMWVSLGRPTLVGKAFSFTHELSFILYIYLLYESYTKYKKQEKNGMHTRYSNENSVSSSVCPSVKRVNCDKTEDRSVQVFT